MGEESDQQVTVLATADPLLVGLAKSLLDEAGIPYVTSGEMLQDLFGAGRLGGFNQVVGPTEIHVRQDDAEEARKVLEDLDRR